MKIAIIQPRVSYYLGGTEKVCLRYIQFLMKLNNKIVLYTTKPTKNYQYSIIYQKFKKQFSKNKNLKIVEFEIPTEREYIYEEYPGHNQNRWDSESILFNNFIFNYLNESNADIVLTYYIVDSIFKPLFFPIVLYLGGFPRKEIKIYGAFLNFVDTVIYNSKNVENVWKKQVAESSVSNEFVLAKAVDNFSIKNIKNPFERNDCFNFVFVGRLIERKGVQKIIKLLTKLKEENLKIKLWVLGEGPEKEKLIRLSKEEGVFGQVNFVGFVENVYDYYHFSDLVILPSLNGEGLMGTVAEAMICGATVITSKGIGNEEIIENSKTGILIDPENEKEFLYSILNLLKNEKKRKKIAKEAQIYAQKNFSWEKVVNKMNGILKLSLKK